MKFNVGSKPFQQQLLAVSKVINSKNALSILDNFLLRVEGDTLTITGSDQENVMTARVEIMESEGDGEIAVSSKMLLEVLKKVAGGQGLTFYVNDETKEIDIKYLNGHFNLMGVDAAEYPRQQPQDASDLKQVDLPAEVILKGISSTIFAVSSDLIRPIMTGIYWDIHESDITFVSSDTHKLVRYINSEVAPGMVTSFIMPPKPANIIKGLLGKDAGDVKLTMDSKSATFEWDTYSLSCRFINGNYPNYNRVIPQDNPFELTIDRMALFTATGRVALCASMASRLVKLNIQATEVLLDARDLDYSHSAEERVMCEYQGNPMTIGFNSSYLVDVLNNLEGETVTIHLSDPSRPAIFKPLVENDKEDILMLLMPMQVLD